MNAERIMSRGADWNRQHCTRSHFLHGSFCHYQATSLISDSAYGDRCYRGLSVCHVRALCSNDRRYRQDFFRIQQPRISDLAKIWLTSANPFSTNLPQSDPDTPPVDLSVGDIRSQIAAEWLEIAQWSLWRAYGNRHRSLEWCHR